MDVENAGVRAMSSITYYQCIGLWQDLISVGEYERANSVLQWLRRPMWTDYRDSCMKIYRGYLERMYTYG